MDKSPENNDKTEIKQKPKRKKQEETVPAKKASSTGLSPNIAGLICYLGVWISGIIFLVLEQKNRSVRFHAAQSIIVFGFLNIIGLILGTIPQLGWFFNLLIGILYFILWIMLMIKAYQNELYRLPLAAELAEKLESATLPKDKDDCSTITRENGEPGRSQEPTRISPVKSTVNKEQHRSFESNRTGRTVASSMAIFWNFVLLIFLNLYSRYIAFYHTYDLNGNTQWVREPILTRDYYVWLPQINIALILAIIGNIIIIIVDNYILYEIMNIFISLVFAVAIGSLLAIFPFDFSTIPDGGLSAALPSLTRLILFIIIAALAISIIVRIIKLTVNLIKNNV